MIYNMCVQGTSVTVVLEKTPTGSLGLKIAGGGKNKTHVYLKAFVGEPAISAKDLKLGN
jgi:hypothetical protein